MRIKKNFTEKVIFELGFKNDQEFLGKIVAGHTPNGVRVWTLEWKFEEAHVQVLFPTPRRRETDRTSIVENLAVQVVLDCPGKEQK